jgi:competence protein ComEC
VRRAPLVLAVLALAAGIAVGLMRPVPPRGGPFLLPAAALGALWALWLCTTPRRVAHPGALLLALMVGAGVLLGAATRTGAERSCVRWVPEERAVAVYGRVTAWTGPGLRLTLDSVRVDGVTLPCAVEVAARWPGLTEPEHPPTGRRLEGDARWWSPPGAGAGILRRPGALVVDRGELAGQAGTASLAGRLRQGARLRVDRFFGAQAPLAASLLLAQRDALDPQVRDRFARAGLSHLLAISGLHVGLVCGIFLLVGSLLRLGRRGSAVMAAAGTVAYVLVLGAPHSAARAALQIVLLLAASMIQRPARPESMVAAAALILLAVEPGALLSPGFQLSFAGVVGLLALRPPILRLLTGGGADGAGSGGGGGKGAAARRWLADSVATSVAATVATAPIVAWHFGQVAPVGILANLVAIPLLSLALPALALTLVAGSVWPAAGMFLAPPGALALRLLDRVAALATTVPGATVSMHGATALMLTIALAAGYVLSRRLGRVRPLIRAAAWAAVAALVLAVAPLRFAGDHLEIHVIDVGQGDAIALRTPAGRWLLVDAGMAGRGYNMGERRVVPYLARRGARRVEGLVLSHPHADHMGGTTAVLATLRPRWIGDPVSPAPSRQYLDLLEGARASGTRWVGLRQGHTLAIDGITVEFLHPETLGEIETDLNDLSVVMRVGYGEFTAILTGDATALVEERLVRRYGAGLKADVLKVGHHGSTTSSTPGFLEATAPPLALVSSGQGNRYGHPHGAVLDRLESSGARVLRTDRHGTITVRVAPGGAFGVETERGGGP